MTHIDVEGERFLVLQTPVLACTKVVTRITILLPLPRLPDNPPYYGRKHSIRRSHNNMRIRDKRVNFCTGQYFPLRPVAYCLRAESGEQLQFRYETHLNLNLEILQLCTVLRGVNPWRAARERIADNQQLTMRLTMFNPQGNDPCCYNRPITDKFAVIILRLDDDNEPFEWDIVIQDRNTGQLQNRYLPVWRIQKSGARSRKK